MLSSSTRCFVTRGDALLHHLVLKTRQRFPSGHKISIDQYRDGVIDFTPVVLFESTLASQQDSFTVARASIALNLIATYRALGGGWEMRLARDGGYSVVPAAPPPRDKSAAHSVEPLPSPQLCPRCELKGVVIGMRGNSAKTPASRIPKKRKKLVKCSNPRRAGAGSACLLAHRGC